MDKPQDIRDRIMKRMLRYPRMVRDLLSLLPAEWAAAVDASNLRELPTEFIGTRGDKRIADLCWLAGNAGGESAIVLIENQSAPDRRMPARAMARTGLLYESLGAEAREPDGRFPPMLVVVVYTGDRPWRGPHDLRALVRVPAGGVFSGLAGTRYARLDLRDPAAQYPEQANRVAALARLTFAESFIDAIRVLKEVREWLDFGDEDEERLYQCYLDWFYATASGSRPRDWNLERERKLEDLMAEQSVLERNNERWLKRYRRELLAEGRRDGLAHERALLVRQAARRFGADTGRRLEALLKAVEDPDRLERVGDLIVDSETGEQLLGGLDGAQSS